MLRQPQSLYVVERRFHPAEGQSLLRMMRRWSSGHLAGTGRHKGRMGAAAEYAWPTGTEFSIGTGFSDKQRDEPPAIGQTVVFRYQELTDGGVPRFPSLYAVREE